jgi:hypothetical protein
MKLYVIMWTGFIWLMICTVVSSCDNVNRIYLAHDVACGELM